LDTFCLPDYDEAKEFVTGFYEQYGGDKISQWVTDLIAIWWITLAAAGISFVLGFLYMLVLKWMAKPIVYISIVLVFILIVLSAFLCYSQSQDMEEDEENQKYVLYLSYGLFGLAAVYILVMLCLCSRIRLAIAIF
jgi:hypothetical protein